VTIKATMIFVDMGVSPVSGKSPLHDETWEAAFIPGMRRVKLGGIKRVVGQHLDGCPGWAAQLIAIARCSGSLQ
jgi:hypothetical protein